MKSSVVAFTGGRQVSFAEIDVPESRAERVYLTNSGYAYEHGDGDDLLSRRIRPRQPLA